MGNIQLITSLLGKQSRRFGSILLLACLILFSSCQSGRNHFVIDGKTFFLGKDDKYYSIIEEDMISYDRIDTIKTKELNEMVIVSDTIITLLESVDTGELHKIVWSCNGKVLQYGSFNNLGMASGLFYNFFPSDSSFCEYYNGLKNGIQVVYKDETKTVTTYKAGLKHGFEYVFVGDNLQWFIEYSMGKLNGLAILYYTQGEKVLIRQKILYKNGEIVDGVYKFNYVDGSFLMKTYKSNKVEKEEYFKHE